MTEASALVVWLRDVLGTLDHEHRVREGARIERRAVAGIGEAPLLPQTLSDDHLGRAPAQDALAAGVVGLVEAGQQPLQVAVAGDGDAEHLPLHAPVEALDHPVRARRVGPGLAVLHAELAAALLEALGREAGAAVGQQVRDPEREGGERLLQERPGAGLGLLSLTARWTERERRSMATNRKRLRGSPLLVRSLGRCFTSMWTKPSSYSLNLLATRSGAAGGGRRLRPAALRMRQTLSRSRCGRKW